jgi:TolB-like protein/class 3 adenylate cyclase/Tfp pilus assembly protein PilF
MSVADQIIDISRDSAALSRQLAAIMFADMMGYTALMQQDEQKAKVLRDRMRQNVDKCVSTHGGRIIQYYGDGVLILFPSAANGVQCAIALQIELQKEPVVPLRMGLHSGEVCFDEHGAYGDCVNVASRIEALSVPGAVLVSDKVYDEIKNQTSISTTSLGLFDLKNVRRQVEVFAITNPGLVKPAISPTSNKIVSERSVAVLPFRNLSADPDNEYFSDGISEDILNALTQVDGLQVCSRTSSFNFKGKEEDVRTIGQKLGVSVLVEGSVRRGGNKVRISAQLISAQDGYQLWSEVFDGDLDDIFRVQDEIASKIVDRLKEKLSDHLDKEQTSQRAEQVEIVKAPTDNIEAYNLFLKGRFHWNKSNPDDIKKAVVAFEKAIELDPDFARPYCMLSYCYSFMGSAGIVPYAEAFSKAKDCTLKAIEIDPNHAESYLSLATIKFMQNWDFQGAGLSIQRARDLGLNSSELNQIDGMLLIAQGRFKEAVEKIERALKQEPLSLSMMCLLADAYAFAKRFDDALAQYDKVIELDPNFRRAYEGKGFTYLAEGKTGLAIENLEQYQRRIGHPLKGLGALGYAYGIGGNRERALECLEKTQQREQSEKGINLNLEYALIRSGLGEYDKAFDHLKNIYEHRSNVVCLGMIYCVRYPILQELKSDIRFKQLTSKMGLNLNTTVQ